MIEQNSSPIFPTDPQSDSGRKRSARRKVLLGLVAAPLAAIAGYMAFMRFFFPPGSPKPWETQYGAQSGPIPLGSVSEFKDATAPVQVALRGASAFVDVNGRSPLVLSALCTHEGCTIHWDAGAARFQCPCHGSEFSPSGQVLRGPATQALESIPSYVQGSTLYAEG